MQGFPFRFAKTFGICAMIVSGLAACQDAPATPAPFADPTPIEVTVPEGLPQSGFERLALRDFLPAVRLGDLGNGRMRAQVTLHNPTPVPLCLTDRFLRDADIVPATGPKGRMAVGDLVEDDGTVRPAATPIDTIEMRSASNTWRSVDDGTATDWPDIVLLPGTSRVLRLTRDYGPHVVLERADGRVDVPDPDATYRLSLPAFRIYNCVLFHDVDRAALDPGYQRDFAAFYRNIPRGPAGDYWPSEAGAEVGAPVALNFRPLPTGWVLVAPPNPVPID
jgi:hypothetical protein